MEVGLRRFAGAKYERPAGSPVPPNRKPQAEFGKLLSGAHLSPVLNQHFEEDGAIIYLEA
jgi:hypothetical protein